MLRTTRMMMMTMVTLVVVVVDAVCHRYRVVSMGQDWPPLVVVLVRLHRHQRVWVLVRVLVRMAIAERSHQALSISLE